MSAGRRCILNAALGSYYTGQARLVKSLQDVGYTGDKIFWRDQYPPGSPTHQQVPYAFKIYALLEARRQGYEVVLWLDASIWAIKNIEPVFRHIEERGHLFEVAGQWLGWYVTDAFLAKNGLSRDAAMTIPMFTAGFTGLDLRQPKAIEFLEKWRGMSQDGVSFLGPWNNHDCACSQDPRCKGHRHDMSAASLLAHRMGMELQPCPTFLVYSAYLTGPPPESVCFYCRGID
jgi:hypothetical protein